MEATAVGAEAAELFMADVVLSLMMMEGFMINETIRVIYLEGLISCQWKNLLPRVSACVRLGYDDGARMTAIGAEAFKTLELKAFTGSQKH